MCDTDVAMAGKLSQGQKAGLIFGGAVLAALLIVGKAEGTFDGIISQKKQPKTKFPPKGQPAKTEEPAVAQVELHTKAVPPYFTFGPDEELPIPAPGWDWVDIGNNGFVLISLAPPDQALAALSPSEVPPIEPWQLGLSQDLSTEKIGSTWIYGQLHPFLNDLRKSEVLAVVEDEWDFDMTDFLFNEPATFINETFDSEHTGGTTMILLYAIASGGLSPAILRMLPVAGKHVATGALVSRFLSGTATLAEAGASSAAAEIVTDPIFEGMGSIVWGDDVANTALEAFGRVINQFKVVHGTQGEVFMNSLPYAGKIAVQDGRLVSPPESRFRGVEELFATIMLAIIDFQSRKFLWDDEGQPSSFWYDMLYKQDP